MKKVSFLSPFEQQLKRYSNENFRSEEKAQKLLDLLGEQLPLYDVSLNKLSQSHPELRKRLLPHERYEQVLAMVDAEGLMKEGKNKHKSEKRLRKIEGFLDGKIVDGNGKSIETKKGKLIVEAGENYISDARLRSKALTQVIWSMHRNADPNGYYYSKRDLLTSNAGEALRAGVLRSSSQRVKVQNKSHRKYDDLKSKVINYINKQFEGRPDLQEEPLARLIKPGYGHVISFSEEKDYAPGCKEVKIFDQGIALSKLLLETKKGGGKVLNEVARHGICSDHRFDDVISLAEKGNADVLASSLTMLAQNPSSRINFGSYEDRELIISSKEEIEETPQRFNRIVDLVNSRLQGSQKAKVSDGLSAWNYGFIDDAEKYRRASVIFEMAMCGKDQHGLKALTSVLQNIGHFPEDERALKCINIAERFVSKEDIKEKKYDPERKAFSWRLKSILDSNNSGFMNDAQRKKLKEILEAVSTPTDFEPRVINV